MGQFHTGICQQPAPVAGMVVSLAGYDLQVDVHAAARAQEDCRLVQSDARPVRGDQHVGGKSLGLVGAKLGKSRGSVFLAHLHEVFQVEAQCAGDADHRLDGGKVHGMLALVVGGSPTVPAAVALGYLEGRQVR